MKQDKEPKHTANVLYVDGLGARVFGGGIVKPLKHYLETLNHPTICTTCGSIQPELTFYYKHTTYNFVCIGIHTKNQSLETDYNKLSEYLIARGYNQKQPKENTEYARQP